jgi:hypothetical protein
MRAKGENMDFIGHKEDIIIIQRVDLCVRIEYCIERNDSGRSSAVDGTSKRREISVQSVHGPRVE